ncbi:hypothetical protein OUZ56_031648 [Daphnia magna]|uniref:Uncharacterized protein n=1 Tax=Daphnia magna TaxID=35525 RepID=A0ABQ9ZUU2_9CRUS|nr:hypothetical protein OUZ56_031648 [Daphnia magna]
MEKRNLRVSALAEGLSAVGLVLAIITVISPYWGRFSSEGPPNSGEQHLPCVPWSLTTGHRNSDREVKKQNTLTVTTMSRLGKLNFFMVPPPYLRDLSSFQMGLATRPKELTGCAIKRHLFQTISLPQQLHFPFVSLII